MKLICTMCKRANPKSCGNQYCPILSKMSFEHRVKFDPKKDYFGDAPNVFVGRYGYPSVNVGLLSTEHYEHNDEPLFWSKNEYALDRIVDLRSVLVNSTFKLNVKNAGNKFLDIGQEVAMASKPVDIEIGFKKHPTFQLKIDKDLMPQGPRVELEKARITENVKVPLQVEKAVSDPDWKAADAMNSLYEKNIDEHHLTRLLSIGNLGVKVERKLVPTRWSITAVDSNISKRMVEELKDYQEYGFVSHFGGHYGNYFLILFFPDVWSYELMETYVGNPGLVSSKKTSTTRDYEPYKGRKKYVEETAGGYYATRLALVEHLRKKKRQSSCLVLRFITDEYYVPLGVWVVREAVRKALQSKPIEFASKELMLNYAKQLVRKKFFNYNLDGLLPRSQLLKEMSQQSKLVNFL
ncbi:hypothetical protein ACFL1B_00545 [Nanoarchaeota archaeon]